MLSCQPNLPTPRLPTPPCFVSLSGLSRGSWTSATKAGQVAPEESEPPHRSETPAEVSARLSARLSRQLDPEKPPEVESGQLDLEEPLEVESGEASRHGGESTEAADGQGTGRQILPPLEVSDV